MTQNAGEVLDDLRKFVADRGRDDNFCYSKVYSSSSYVRCIDFSPWVGKRILMNDLFALAVFEAQLSRDSSFGVSITFTHSDDGEIEISDEEGDDDYDDEPETSFDDEIKRHMDRIEKVIHFPFDEYFTGETKLAKLDLRIAWLLNYPYGQFPKILSAYNLSLNNAQVYIERYNREKKTRLELPPQLPDGMNLDKFRSELQKLPLATRLHLFDTLAYAGFSKNNKNPKMRLISDMTLYDTRKVGIDEFESANILRQSKLIVSFPDGTGYLNPDFVEVISMTADYAKEMTPVYRSWYRDATNKLLGFDDSDDELFSR